MGWQVGLAIALLMLVADSSAQISARAIMERSVHANAVDWKAAPGYECFERDREAGGRTKTFEDLMLFGSPYQRLVAVNGKPLSRDQQAEQQQELDAVLAERRDESGRNRAKRIAEYQKDRDRDHLMMEQLAKAFRFVLIGEQTIEGRDVYVLSAIPRPDYQPPNMEAEALRGMQGKLWIDKTTFQWVKVEAQVIRPVSIEGFLAEVEPGTRFELEKMPVQDGVWLPKHYAMKANAKVLFLFHHKSQEEENYYGYHERTPTEQVDGNE